MQPALAPAVVKQAEPLADSHRPAELPGREAQARELRDLLLGPRTGHVWLHGPPGTGKTSLAHHALALLEARQVRTAYVNCWGNQTFFAVLEAVFQELHAVVPERPQLAFRIEQVGEIAKRGPLVIALDEVDQMFRRERSAAIYNLATLDRATLVCLSQGRGVSSDTQSSAIRRHPVFRTPSRQDPGAEECRGAGSGSAWPLRPGRAETVPAPRGRRGSLFSVPRRRSGVSRAGWRRPLPARAAGSCGP